MTLKKEKVEELLIKFIKEKEILPATLISFETFLIDRQYNKKNKTTWTGFTIAKIGNLDSKINKVCIFIEVHKDLRINNARLSYFEDYITTPIELNKKYFNSKIEAEILENSLNKNKKEIYKKLKI